MKQEGKIFISYRRDASQWQAFSVYYSLKEVHKRIVFLDLVTMGGGDFHKMISDAIDSSRHFVLILSNNTLSLCVEKDDWLLKEIKRAIRKKRNIVPLFFDGFSFKDHEDLLDRIQLQKLKKYNGTEITPDAFSECIEKLNNKYLVDHPDIIEEDKKPTGEIVRFALKAAQTTPESVKPIFRTPSPAGMVFSTPSLNRTSYISGTADFWKLNKEEEKLDSELNLNIPGLYHGGDE
jgi:hypothetical protein